MDTEKRQLPPEYYRLVITRRVRVSKSKTLEVRSVFDWEDKADALAVKELLSKANTGALCKDPGTAAYTRFTIVHPDEDL